MPESINERPSSVAENESTGDPVTQPPDAIGTAPPNGVAEAAGTAAPAKKVPAKRAPARKAPAKTATAAKTAAPAKAAAKEAASAPVAPVAFSEAVTADSPPAAKKAASGAAKAAPTERVPGTKAAATKAPAANKAASTKKTAPAKEAAPATEVAPATEAGSAKKAAPAKKTPAAKAPAKKAAKDGAPATKAATKAAGPPAAKVAEPAAAKAAKPLAAKAAKAAADAAATKKVAAASGTSESAEVRVPLDDPTTADAPPRAGKTTTSAGQNDSAQDLPARGASAPEVIMSEPTEASAPDQGTPLTGPQLFATIAREPFVSLTTFRRDGTPVPTPVWAAPDGARLVVWTGANSGKVKRLRHTSKITVAPCDKQGRLLGEPVPAQGRIMGKDEMPRVMSAMQNKYGWQFRFSAWGTAIGRFLRIAPHGQIGVEITLD